MSKYTTLVRTICENNSGLNESVGLNGVNEVLEKSWDKIFDSSFPIFDESYRKTLCMKILSHFYMREICCETVGLWKLWLNQKMYEIMPYYNKLYESELLRVEPFNDVDYTRTGNRTSADDEETNGNRNGKSDRNASNSSNGKELFSDTPQGGLSGVVSMNYLTNATISEDTSNGTDSVNNSDTYTENKNRNGNENYSENVKGKMNTKSYSSLLKEYRESFLNIDMQIISELEELFFGLW